MFRLLVLISMASLVLCKSTDPQKTCDITDPQKTIEIKYPKGGETFSYGKEVSVQWVADSEQESQVTVQILAEGDSIWRNITDRGVAVEADGGSRFICMNTVWTIGSEWDPVAYGSTTTAKIRVGRYGVESLYRDVSGTFTIKK